MKNYRNSIEEFLNNEFAKDLMNSISQNATISATQICDFCDELDKSEDGQNNTEIANKIFNTYNMKFKEIELCKALCNANNVEFIGKKTIELNKFLKTFCMNCNLHVKNMCEVKLAKCKDAYLDINRKILSFILVMPVRKALKHSSKTMKISFSSELNHITICLKATKGRKLKSFDYTLMNDSFLDKYENDIMTFVLEKVGGSIREEGDCIYIELPESKGGVLHSDERLSSNEDKVVNNMLADFSEYDHFGKRSEQVVK